MVCDRWNHSIRLVSTAASNGGAGGAVGAAAGGPLVRLSASVTTIAGGSRKQDDADAPQDGHDDGTGPAARFKYPSDVAAARRRDGFAVSDTCNHVLRKVSLDGTVRGRRGFVSPAAAAAGGGRRAAGGGRRAARSKQAARGATGGQQEAGGWGRQHA